MQDKCGVFRYFPFEMSELKCVARIIRLTSKQRKRKRKKKKSLSMKIGKIGQNDFPWTCFALAAYCLHNLRNLCWNLWPTTATTAFKWAHLTVTVAGKATFYWSRKAPPFHPLATSWKLVSVAFVFISLPSQVEKWEPAKLKRTA